jgi:hypothetical protein
MKQTLTRARLLAARPRRAAGLEALPAGERQWRITVTMQPRSWARRVLRLPQTVSRSFELDERGKFVWDACDGERSIAEIVNTLVDFCKVTHEELEPATLKFLDMLLRRGMIVITLDSTNE